MCVFPGVFELRTEGGRELRMSALERADHPEHILPDLGSTERSDERPLPTQHEKETRGGPVAAPDGSQRRCALPEKRRLRELLEDHLADHRERRR